MTMTPLLMAVGGGPARTVPDRAVGRADWAAWTDYFAENQATQRVLEDRIDWGLPVDLTERQQRRWVRSLQPVSYTHLDVYKRQGDHRLDADEGGHRPEARPQRHVHGRDGPTLSLIHI